MSGVSLLFLCSVGLVLAASQNTDKWGSFLASIQQTLSNGMDNGKATCDHVDRKDHAIALLQEWVNHNHYDAVEKMYHDIYHHDIPQKRQFLGGWHPPANITEEAFFNNNPNYFHVENYVKFWMNAACRTDIMKWIENLAHTHTATHTNGSATNALQTVAPVTSSPQTQPPATAAPHTNAPTTHAAQTHAPTTIAALAVKGQCNPVTFVTALARGNILAHAGAGLCTDGTASRPEALILESCNTPSVAKWKQGAKVIGNCERIPDYTPIAMFKFGTFVQDGASLAGIITDCTPNGFKIAIQLCGHPVNLFEFKSDAKDQQQNAANYYVIDFD